VAYYRIYLISVADKIVECRDVTCAKDEDALAIALPLLPEWPIVEIWDGIRRVVRLTTPSPAGSAHFRVHRSYGCYRSARMPVTAR
jgi:hypothetical protein